MDDDSNDLHPRFIESRLAEALEDSPVVLIQGPRQCGKTTLAQMVCAPDYLQGGARLGEADNRGYGYISFDDDVVRAGAAADPMGFVADLPEYVVLDEVQRVPGTLHRLKAGSGPAAYAGPLRSDRLNQRASRSHGARLSGRPLGDRPVAPLGSMRVVRRPPPDAGFIETLFGGNFLLRRTERLGEELAERLVSGGYPPALARPAGRRRANWYRNYIDAQVQRDIGDLSRISSLDALPRLFSMAATQTGKLFNLSSLTAPFQLSRPTIGDYIALLERVYLLERLPPWHNNLGKRLVKTPKLHIGDTGLACALLGASAQTLLGNRSLLGPLLETFVYQELRRQATWHDEPVEFFHYRDKDQIEVDIVLECGGKVAGVEVRPGPQLPWRLPRFASP